MRGAWPADELRWPTATTLHGLRDWIERNELLRLCCGSELMTDELLTDVLRSLERHDRDAAEVGRTLLQEAAEKVSTSDGPDALTEELEKITADEWLAGLECTASEVEAARTDFHGARFPRVEHVENVLHVLTPSQAQELWTLLADSVRAWRDQVALHTAERCVARVNAKWSEQLNVWRPLEEVFGPLGSRLGLGWNLSAGIFQSRGWLDLKKYQDILKRLPQISDLVRELGKLQVTDDIDDELSFPDLFESLKRSREEEQEIEHPLARNQAKGYGGPQKPDQEIR